MLEPIIYVIAHDDEDGVRNACQEALGLGQMGYRECDEVYDDQSGTTYLIFHDQVLNEDQLRELVDKHNKAGTEPRNIGVGSEVIVPQQHGYAPRKGIITSTFTNEYNVEMAVIKYKFDGQVVPLKVCKAKEEE